MMTGENIVCFAKDWSEDPTSNNHVMRMLGRDNKILWLNSIATRTPSLGSSSDVEKIKRKLKSFVDGPKQIGDGLSVFTPLVLPFPHNQAAVLANRQILRGTVGLFRRKLGMGAFQLWSFIPTAVEYFAHLGESLRVYYCTDEWSQFSYVDSARIVAMEKRLMEMCDVVFCTSRTLLETKKQYNPNTFLASHGVDYAHFSQALDPSTPLAPELEGLKGPVLGFFGLIHDWIDLDLIGWIAAQRPQWNIVMIGKVAVDNTRWKHLSNIHWLGRRPYESLPSYCKGFDVGLIPFALNELTRNVNPIKLREYLSAGLPVASTHLPEVALCKEWCEVADTKEEFLARCEAALKVGSPEQRRKRAEAMRVEDWDNKVAQLGEHVMNVKAARGR
jgi:hypothetical protein